MARTNGTNHTRRTLEKPFRRSRLWAASLVRVAACTFVFAPLLAAWCLAKAAPANGSRSEAAGPSARPRAARASPAGFALKSPAFEAEGNIPAQFSCQGSDISPALSWTDAPSKTQSFALIVDDPDAPSGNWVHWVAYDLPRTLQALPEGIPKQENIPGGGVQGQNDFRKIGYGGPCPPPGKPHRYLFKLYALDSKLNLQPGAAKSDVEKAMKSHVLSKAELVGRFAR